MTRCLPEGQMNRQVTGVRIPRRLRARRGQGAIGCQHGVGLVLLAFGRQRGKDIPLVGHVIMYDEHVRITRAAARRLRDALIEEIGLGRTTKEPTMTDKRITDPTAAMSRFGKARDAPDCLTSPTEHHDDESEAVWHKPVELTNGGDDHMPGVANTASIRAPARRCGMQIGCTDTVR